ncbi:hypothetical protein [Xylanibacter rodentium]|jgi:hypothetical protein|uniref:hypothetical protein n=1 Tax=Xylanibacter rodentium TaxID=2736289 RepID=UPI00258CED94|nr:hypothetical protein [Xylanibacter rodentium]
MKNSCIIGTVLKINVHIERICCLTMDDYDFECEFYVYPNRKVTVAKSDMIRKNEDNYVAIVDTSVTGTGRIQAKVTAMIPDNDILDGVRREVASCSTGVTVMK